jgi:hypothetical protein
MKTLCALLLAVTCACATGSSSSGNAQASASKPDAQSCSPMIPAVAYRGTDLYEGPDSSFAPFATLKDDTPVCASANTAGFGFRRVKLANGKTGYVAENSLSN